MYEQARTYLSRVMAWPQDGDAPAYVNIHTTFVGEDGKIHWGGRAARSLNEAINAIEWALKQPATKDIYACLATQRTAKEKSNLSGYTYYAPIRSQDNALALKSLFLDIDFKGGEHGYQDQSEALTELARFAKETNLPKPSLIVKSGGGLHVYWTLAQALTVSEWQPLAYSLAEATKKHNLKCDTQVTVDAARVLRIPNTFNRKLATPRPVSLAYDTGEDYSVERLVGVLEPYRGNAPHNHAGGSLVLDHNLFPPKPPVENELGAGLEEEKSLFPLDAIANECAWVAEAIKDGGKNYTEPLWNLTALLATHTEGQVADLHRMSNQHATYDKEATEEKFARAKAKELGWPNCTTVSSTGYKGCQACKHFKAGRTPIHAIIGAVRVGLVGGGSNSVGLAQQQITQQVNDLPSGYVRDAKGVVNLMVGNKDGTSTPVPVALYSMEDPQIHDSPEQLSFLSQISRGPKRRVYIELKSIGTMEMRSVLHSQGFMLHSGSKQMDMAVNFMVSWIKVLRETRDSVGNDAFGWVQTTNKGPDGFAFGGRLWTPTGSMPVANSDPSIAANYKPCGDIAPWLAAAKLVTNQKRPALDAVLATAFAGPLVMFTGHQGTLISVYSKETGIGKTTAMRTAQAVWGHHIKATQMLTDTENNVMAKMTRLKSIPVYWDEIKTEEDAKRFVRITFQTGGGREKARMGRDTKLRQLGEFQTLLVSASNDSILGIITGQMKTSPAGVARVFEIIVPPGNGVGHISSSTATLMIDELRHNHSNVGLEYAKWLGMNHPQVAADMKQLMLDIEKEFSMVEHERFYVLSICSLLLGARYANQLNFTQIDEVALKKYLTTIVLPHMRNQISDNSGDMNKNINVLDVLNAFITAMRGRHMLFTNKIHTGAGQPAKGSIKVETTHCSPQNLQGVYVQYGVEDKTLRITRNALRTWLEDNKYSTHVFTAALKSLYGAEHVQGRIASGVPQFRGGTEHLYEINHPDIDYS